MKRLSLTLVLIASSAFAQQPTPYTPLDEASWNQMVQALSEVPMAYRAHQQMFGVLDAAQQRAFQIRQQAATPPKSN